MASPIVLIIDDEDSQREWVRDVLESCLPSFTIQEANSLDLARARIREVIDHHLDVRIAVVDLNLSKPINRAEGLVLVREIREALPGCFIILVSSKDNLYAEVKPGDPRIDYIVSLSYLKPDPTDELLTALAKATQPSQVTQIPMASCSMGPETR